MIALHWIPLLGRPWKSGARIFAVGHHIYDRRGLRAIGYRIDDHWRGWI